MIRSVLSFHEMITAQISTDTIVRVLQKRKKRKIIDTTLRMKLERDPNNPTLIKTVVGVGYRLLAN